MSTATVRLEFRVDGVLTDVTTAKLKDSSNAYGVKRQDTDAVVVAAGTAMSRESTGVYSYSFTEPALGLTYSAMVEAVHLGRTYYVEKEITGTPVAGTPSTLALTYSLIREEVAHFAGWQRDSSDWTAEQSTALDRYIASGLRKFYFPAPPVPGQVPHCWSFLRPTAPLSTEAPYATGTVVVVDGVVTLSDGTFPSWAAGAAIWLGGAAYAVDTRDGDTQVTLEDLTVDVNSGSAFSIVRQVYDLPTGFAGFISPVTFDLGASGYYPPLEHTSPAVILARNAEGYEEGTPSMFAVQPKAFDTSGSQAWEILYWPTPDAAYTLKGRYRVNPPILSDAQPYPLGGEDHAETILAACLAAAEQRMNDTAGLQTQEFLRLLAGSIDRDKAAYSPDTLGVDHGQEADGVGVNYRRTGTIYWDAGGDYEGIL